MSDTVATEDVLGRVLEELTALRAENEEMRTQVAELRGATPTATGPPSGPEGRGPFSRRQLLGLGGAAAAGAALAVGGGVLRPDPAEAASSVVLGGSASTNNAGGNFTG